MIRSNSFGKNQSKLRRLNVESLENRLMLSVAPVQVVGNHVQFGSQDNLAGNSFFWSNTQWGAEKYYNADVVEWLKDDWDTTIIRAAMGVDEPGGYLQDPVANLNRVRAVVDAAIANDLYVIIDWHSHHAENYEAQAISFFQQMATEYGQYENVIYEIYNEPVQVSWSDTIKPYAENVISAIRAIDPDNLVIVGTSTYSQDVDQAAVDPIIDNNVAYTLHFYAGTHGQSLRNKATTALNLGIPLVVTEWGTVNASGDGAVDVASTNEWIEFLDQNKITHLNWSVNDKVEGASILRPNASSSGGWSDNQLTTSGTFVRDIIRSYGGVVDTGTGGGNTGGGNTGGGNTGGGPSTGVVSEVIYDDSLADGWNNWSWNTNAWLSSPNPAYSGSTAISVNHEAAYAGLYLRSSSLVSLQPDEEIRFQIHGGNSGGQTINVKVVAPDDSLIEVASISPTAGTWTEVVIDYPDSSAPGSIFGLVLQDGSGGSQPTFHVDQVEIGDFASDGGAVVNNAPVAADDSYATTEGGSLNVPANAVLGIAGGVLVNDTDDDGDTLTATVLAGPANGTVTLNSDGSFSYTHNGGQTTSDSFTYTVSDGSGGSDTATVSLSISGANDVPVATDDSYSTSEGGSLNIPAAGVLGNDTDIDGDTLTATILAGPANGVAVLNSNGSFAYTHDGGESTSDSFTYTVDDGNGGTDTATVNISVSGVNDVPVGTLDLYTVAEGDTLTVEAAVGVLANDSDADGDVLSVTLLSEPTNGTATLSSDGSFVYVHDGSETTGDSFTYTADDGNGGTTTATVVLTVTPVDDSLPCDYVNVGDGCNLADIEALYDGVSGPLTNGLISQWLGQASDAANPAKLSTSDVYVIGDVNLDGDVDSTDLGLLLNNFGDDSGLKWGSGNLDTDSAVDSTDLGLLLNNFAHASAAVAATSVSAVPGDGEAVDQIFANLELDEADDEEEEESLPLVF